jgi:hypothetical protein
MVAAVRQGQGIRAVARRFGVGVATVARWVERARGQRLDRVEWADRPCAPHKTRRTDASLEDLVLSIRRELAHSDLGAQGVAAIRSALQQRGLARAPSERTIIRILGRRGALDGKKRTRRPAPPRGWYLPDLAGSSPLATLRRCCDRPGARTSPADWPALPDRGEVRAMTNSVAIPAPFEAIPAGDERGNLGVVECDPEACPVCWGFGAGDGDACPRCNGTGCAVPPPPRPQGHP